MSLLLKPEGDVKEIAYDLPIEARELRCWGCNEFHLQTPKKLVLTVGKDELKATGKVYPYRRFSVLIYAECEKCGFINPYPAYYFLKVEKR